MNVFNLKAVIGLDTSDYEAELKKSHGLAESFGSKLGDVFSSAVSKVGDLMSGAASKVSGFLTDAVKTGADFDTAMSQVAATMGKSADEIGELREFAMEMGRTTQYSAVESAEALNYMALAGYDSATAIAMLPNVMNLAAAGAYDLARASDQVTDVQTAFGLSVERTAQMVDEMAKASTLGNTNVEQLGDAFLGVGGLLQYFHGSSVLMSDGTRKATDNVQDLEIALVAMANAGIKGSEAGTHMRNMLTKLTSGEKSATEALEKYIGSVYKDGKLKSIRTIFEELSTAFGQMEDDEEKMHAIGDIFNTRDTAAQAAIINAMAGDWDRIGQGILDSAGAAEKMAETQLDNLAGDVTKFKSALEGAKIELSDKFSPVLRRVVEGGTDWITKLTDSFSGENGIAEKVSAFFDPLLDYFEIFQANGLGQTLTAIGWDIDAFARKIERFDLKELFDSADFSGFTDNLRKIGEIGSRLVSAIGTAIVNNAGAIGDSVIPLLTSLGNALTDTSRYSQYVDMAKGAITNFCDGLLKKENIDLFFSEDKGIPKILANIATNLGTGISAIITAAGDIIGKILGYMVDPANQETIKNGAIKILTALRDALKKVIESLDVTFNNVMKALATALGEQFDGTEAGFEIAEKLAHGIWENFKRNALWLPTAIGEWLAGEGEESVPEHASSSHSSQANGPSSRSASSRSTSSGNTTADYYQHLGESAASSASTGNTTADYYMNLGARGHALGGIVTRPTYALIGEQGAEAVMPLEHNTGWIRELAQELGGGQTVIQFGDIYVNGDADAGQQVAEQIDRALRELQIRQARGIGGTAWKR